jgi:hypothetical protein
MDLMVVCTGYDWNKGVHGLKFANFNPQINVAIMDRSYFSRLKMYR